MTDNPFQKACTARIKLCIDRHLAGDFEVDLMSMFGGKEIRALVMQDDICFVRTKAGDFGILEDGSVVPAEITRKH